MSINGFWFEIYNAMPKIIWMKAKLFFVNYALWILKYTPSTYFKPSQHQIIIKETIIRKNMIRL